MNGCLRIVAVVLAILFVGWVIISGIVDNHQYSENYVLDVVAFGGEPAPTRGYYNSLYRFEKQNQALDFVKEYDNPESIGMSCSDPEIKISESDLDKVSSQKCKTGFYLVETKKKK